MKRDLGKKFKKNDAIFLQGDPAECMYVIQKGQVELWVESEYGAKQLTMIQEGEVFGEVSLFAGKSRFASARAMEDTWVLTLDEKNFVSQLHRDPSLAFRVIRQMARRIYDQDQEIVHGFIDEKHRSQNVVGFISYIDLVALVEKELSRAKRLWQTLSFAIIDIDHFEILQEKFGSAVGEDLLQSLDNTLRETLRRQDVTGRFGEDQFGLLLYETDGQTAVRILGKVRKAFTDLWKRAEVTGITATFSCGIATFPDYGTVAKLNKAAYKALVASKKTGNQIILASPSQEEQT